MMMNDGRGALFAPTGMADGPLPTHYEPIESPVANLLYPDIDTNPAALRWKRPENPYHEVEDPRYPIVATSFRLTEHHTAGAMSRNLPWLAELQPEMFAELDPVLARERGIEDGGWMVIETARGEIEARAKVSERMRPLKIDGQLVHQIALPYHWGFSGPVTGDSVNDLGVLSGDPNVMIQESKAFTCEVRAGRRSGETTARLAGAAAALREAIGVPAPQAEGEGHRRALAAARCALEEPGFAAAHTAGRGLPVEQAIAEALALAEELAAEGGVIGR
jgi:formate dehydrogenase major subunit